MKNLNLFVLLVWALLSLVSCVEDPVIPPKFSNDDFCETSFDCPLDYDCDVATNRCVPTGGEGSSGGNSNDDGLNDGGNSGGNSSGGDSGGNSGGDSGGNSGGGNQGSIVGPCDPGKVQICEYQGSAATENVGPCRAGERTCQDDRTWGPCIGEVLPQIEWNNPNGQNLCDDGIDNDCNGEVDDGTDLDGDGHGACSDCCEQLSECPDPKSAWNPETDLCAYAEPIDYDCDSSIDASSKDPTDYAKAIGICAATTADSAKWGLISAKILKPDGNLGASQDAHGILTRFGDVIKPLQGTTMLALTSSRVGEKLTQNYEQNTRSNPPSDWYAANGNKFPVATSCSSSGSDGDINDAVMLELKIKVPLTAKSFSVNIYFLTFEYPIFVCTSFNDFFIALLDSKYQSDDPSLQNPADKNLAMDSLGNPVGVNLAPAGLFKQCVNAPDKNVYSCEGVEELAGTGLEKNGGTGWLITRGNVVGGEIITLRFAIWDLEDHIWDSIVLIDNFKWDVVEYTPGTGAM